MFQIIFDHFEQNFSDDQLQEEIGIIHRDATRNSADVQAYLDQCDPADWLSISDDDPTEFASENEAREYLTSRHKGPDACGVNAAFAIRWLNA